MPELTSARQSARSGVDASTMPEHLLEVLLFEARWRSNGRRKGDAVRERFGISSTTYRTRLGQAVQYPAAYRIAPATVRMNGGPRTDTRVPA